MPLSFGLRNNVRNTSELHGAELHIEPQLLNYIIIIIIIHHLYLLQYSSFFKEIIQLRIYNSGRDNNAEECAALHVALIVFLSVSTS